MSDDVGMNKDEEIKALRAENAMLREKIKQLEALVEKLLRNSSNSHKPPRTDSPKDKAKRAKAKKPRSRRRRGGQVGHKGHHREMVPPERVDQFVDCFANSCQKCGHHLQGEDPRPHLHQVVELPPVQAKITEYRLHRRRCPSCSAVTKGNLPPQVGSSNFGPRLHAACALLSAKYHLSKKDTVEALGDMMGIKLCAASVCRNEDRVARALGPSSDEALEHLRKQEVVHMDETSWRTSGYISWLWSISGGLVALFAVCDERAGIVARELLGDGFEGIVHTDRYGGYNHLPDEQRQYCWAHLARDFEAMSLRPGQCGRIGKRLVKSSKKIFRLTRQIRDGTLDRAEFVEKMQPVIEGVRKELKLGSNVSDRPFGGMCKNLLKHDTSLWLFVHHQGVEATNNEAERNMRKGVLWRSRSGGNDSVKGTIFTERMLTVIETMRRQGRNALEFVADTLKAYWAGHAPPSLLPTP